MSEVCTLNNYDEYSNNMNRRVFIFIVKKQQEEVSQRSIGFDILKNKIKIDKRLLKTKMCSLGNNCTRGSNCRFAHSEDELSISECVFGDECRFIYKDGNKIINISKTKICNHKHPGEDKDSFYKRIGGSVNNTPIRIKKV